MASKRGLASLQGNNLYQWRNGTHPKWVEAHEDTEHSQLSCTAMPARRCRHIPQHGCLTLQPGRQLSQPFCQAEHAKQVLTTLMCPNANGAPQWRADAGIGHIARPVHVARRGSISSFLSWQAVLLLCAQKRQVREGLGPAAPRVAAVTVARWPAVARRQRHGQLVMTQ
eukprot:237969-Chlamydomonas_euryale.AAC.1